MLKPGRPLVVVDLETTGVDPQADRIVEIGACVVDPNTFEVVRRFETRVKPDRASTPIAHAIHGLGSTELADAPSEEEALGRFCAFAGAEVRLAGHNVCFDATFLRMAIARTGVPMDIDYHLLDSWSVASVFLSARGQEESSGDLDAICERFGISRPQPHRALHDAEAAAGVLRRIKERIQADGGAQS